jgi:integrase/recombinase XerD
MIQSVKQGQPKGSATFATSLKSFLGYLEGTEKAAHTIKSYRLDILAFQKFLEKSGSTPAIALSDLTERDLARYAAEMKEEGLKTNTRRRRLITVQRFLGFLVKRKKLDERLGSKIAAPHKIERVPLTVDASDLMMAIGGMPETTLLDLRNKALLWTLAETGCQVSEVAKLTYESYSRVRGKSAKIEFPGKNARELPVAPGLVELVERLEHRAATSPRGASDCLFTGFNKSGSMGHPITSRGVELLVRAYADPFGMPGLTPRTFRHSRVLQWLSEKMPEAEIQKRLGLKTAYAFRVYGPILQAMNSESALSKASRSSSKTTSSGEKPAPESEAPQE